MTSLFATGVAVGLAITVEFEVEKTPDDRGDYLITARWTGPDPSSESDRAPADESI